MVDAIAEVELLGSAMFSNWLATHRISEITAAALHKAVDDVHKVIRDWNTVNNFTFHKGDTVWTSAFQLSIPQSLDCCLPFCWSRWPGHKASLPRYAGKKGCIILVLPISAKCEAVGHCYQPEATTDPDGAVLAIQISQSKSFSYRGFTVPGKWCLGHWSRYGVFYHFLAIRYHFGTHYFDTHRDTVSIPSENQIMNYDYHNFYF